MAAIDHRRKVFAAKNACNNNVPSMPRSRAGWTGRMVNCTQTALDHQSAGLIGWTDPGSLDPQRLVVDRGVFARAFQSEETHTRTTERVSTMPGKGYPRNRRKPIIRAAAAAGTDQTTASPATPQGIRETLYTKGTNRMTMQRRKCQETITAHTLCCS